MNQTGSPGWRIVAAADCNSDGVPDLVWENDDNTQISVWYMGGVGGAAMQSWSWITSPPSGGWRVAAASDFNGDGVPDLVLQNDARQAQVWYMGDVGGSAMQSWSWINQNGSPGWRIVAAADFNGDGVPDLAWEHDSTYQVSLWYMGGVGGATMQSWAWLNYSGWPGWRATNYLALYPLPARTVTRHVRCRSLHLFRDPSRN